MANAADFQGVLGTALITFSQTGTYSTWAQLNGRLVGCYADSWPGAAGSLTWRSSWDTSGTGWPVMSEAGVLARVNGFGSGTFYSFTPGTVPAAAQYLMGQVGTAGTAGIAGGGTVVLIVRAGG